MAQRGRPLSIDIIKRILRARQVQSIRAAARTAGVDKNTAKKYIRAYQGVALF